MLSFDVLLSSVSEQTSTYQMSNNLAENEPTRKVPKGQIVLDCDLSPALRPYFTFVTRDSEEEGPLKAWGQELLTYEMSQHTVCCYLSHD